MLRAARHRARSVQRFGRPTAAREGGSGTYEHPPVYLQYDMRGPMRGLRRPADLHLRSAEIVLGFAVRARGEHAGRLRDLELDAGHWMIEALVIDSGVWLPGDLRPVSPREVRSRDWIARTIELR